MNPWIGIPLAIGIVLTWACAVTACIMAALLLVGWPLAVVTFIALEVITLRVWIELEGGG